MKRTEFQQNSAARCRPGVSVCNGDSRDGGLIAEYLEDTIVASSIDTVAGQSRGINPRRK